MYKRICKQILVLSKESFPWRANAKEKTFLLLTLANIRGLATWRDPTTYTDADSGSKVKSQC